MRRSAHSRTSVASLALLLVGLCSPALRGQGATQLSIIRSQHRRLAVSADIQRIAVGDPEMLSAEPLNNRELLLLGKSSGRTTLLVWFKDGSVREYICTVHRDLSLLQSAMSKIHPSIVAEIAPDRDAIVLTGTVPDITYLRAAESAAHNYLDATPANANSRVLIRDDQATGAAATATPASQAGSASTDAIRVPVIIQASGKVINLIRVENLPPLAEEKIVTAIREIGGSRVTVRRVLKGQVRDDNQDIFVLEGRVPNQVALTRILTVSAQVVMGQALAAQDIRVVADEAGALAFANQAGGAGGVGGGGGGGGVGGGGGLGGGGGGGLTGGGANLTNQIRKNIGRAKVLEAGGGRLISFIEVADLPQVRVDIRLYEVNRTKLKNYNPNISAILGSQHVGSIIPSPAATAAGAVNVGPTSAIQNILGFLGGTLTNTTQLTAGHFALDSVLQYLEQQGIARSLSSPSLTVLSGEQAQFQVGGDIPVPQTTTTGTSLAVFQSVQFLSFGIVLNIRPLVGDDETLTLDVLPSVSTPDTALTSSIQSTTGTNQLTTAFQTRSLRTSARVEDGQALLIGGLLSRTTDDTQASTPGLRDVPGLGWLFKNLNRTDDSQELIIVVNPVIVRDHLPNTSLWEYPSVSEAMDTFTKDRLPAGKAVLAKP